MPQSSVEGKRVATSETTVESGDLIKVNCKPVFRRKVLHNEHLTNADGDMVSQYLRLIDLTTDAGTITVLWGSRTSPPPVSIKSSRQYTFVVQVKQLDGRKHHVIQKILDGEATLFENKGQLKPFPLPARRK